MDQRITKTLVIRYFGGQCTPEETSLVEEWLKQEDNNKQMQEWLWEDWEETAGKMPATVSVNLQKKLQEQIGGKTHGSIIPLNRRRSYAVVAAAVLLLITSAVWLLVNVPHRKVPDQNALAYKDSICNKGDQPMKATLPDGSIVWLNAASVIYIADNFGATERRVKMNGEAFFEIHPDAKRPFYTEAAGVITKVLGTAYDIEAYPNEKEIRISLLHGKVAVRSRRDTTLMAPGQTVTFSKQSGELSLTAMAISDPSAWTKGKIVLNKISLPEALNRLSRLYHVPIHYNYELLQEKYIVGEFEHDTLPQVLQSVLFVHNLKFKIANGACTIY